MKYLDFIQEREGTVRLNAIAAPPVEFDSILATFTSGLEHERHITAQINALMDLAVRESDHATQGFLRWFIDEQVEEEGTIREIVQRLRLVGQEGMGLYLVDKELATRAAPAAAPAQ